MRAKKLYTMIACALLLAAVLISGLPGGSAAAAPDWANGQTAISVSNETQWQDAFNSAGDVLVIEVTGDFSITKAVQLSRDRQVYLHGTAPHEISVSSGVSSLLRHIEITQGASVELCLDDITLQGSETRGGGIQVNAGGSLILDGSDNSFIQGVKGHRAGGAIALQSAKAAKISNITLADCGADSTGGGMWIEQTASVALNRVTMSGNSANMGGGIYAIGATTQVEMTNCSFKSNKAVVLGATGGTGAGVFVDSGSLTDTASRFEGNTAAGGGGGLFIQHSAVVKLTDTVFYNNSGAVGGAINATGQTVSSSGQIELIGVKADNNEANTNGGAIYAFYRALSLSNCEIGQSEGNTANLNGGGIYLWSAQAKIVGGSISHNQAGNSQYLQYAAGGGIYLYESTSQVELSNVKLTENKSGTGGAIGVQNKNLWAKIVLDKDNKPEFSDNTASNYVTEITAADKLLHSQYAEDRHVGPSVDATGTQLPYLYNNYDIGYPNCLSNIYTITYEINGDTDALVDPAHYISGAQAKILEPPSGAHLGYSFKGWSAYYVPSMQTDIDKWTGTVTVDKSLSLYAVLEEQTHSVTFDLNGGKGTVPASASVSHGASLGTLPTLAGDTGQLGYVFDGWYTEDGDRTERSDVDYRTYDESKWSQEWTAAMPVEDSMVLYARWKEAEFSVDGSGSPALYHQHYEDGETQLQIALSSLRETIDIKLLSDVELTAAMRATQLNRDADTVTVNITGDSGGKEIRQTGNERHFYLLNRGTAIVLNLDNITANSDTGYGGIAASEGALVLNGKNTSAVEGIDANTEGGAFAVMGGGSLHLKNITIEGCEVSGLGGGILVQGGSQAKIENVTLKNNTAHLGGAIAVRDGAQATVINCTVEENSADIGGGLYLAGSGSKLSVSESRIAENTAEDHGGAIGLGSLAARDGLGVDNVAFGDNEAAVLVEEISLADKSDHDTHITGSTPFSSGTDYGYNNYDISLCRDVVTVEYYPNHATSGTAPVDSTVYGAGALVTIRDKGNLDRTHYQFAGWQDGNDGTYSPGTPVALNESVKLYANWVRNTHTLTFNANGGMFDGGKTTEELVVDAGADTDSVAFPEPVQDGYIFKGWTVQPNDWDTADIVEKDYHFTAQWEQQQYFAIVYHVNGGTPVSSIEVTDGTELVKSHTSSETPERHGYSFGGWFLDEDLSDAVAGSGVTVENAANVQKEVHVYAGWEVNEYTVSWDDGINSPYIESHPYLSQIDPYSYTPTAPVGKTFTGWYWDNGQTDPVMGTLLVTENLTFYAEWTETVYTVNYYVDNELYAQRQVEYGECALELSVGVEGYELEDWLVNGSKFVFDLPLTGPELVIDLHAKLKEIKFTLNFYQDVVTGTFLEGVPARYGEQLYEVPVDEPDLGVSWYTFAYWGLESGLNISDLFVGYPILQDWDVYAHWQYAPTVEISFEGGGDDSSFSILEQTSVTLEATAAFDGNDGDEQYQWYRLHEGQWLAIPNANGATLTVTGSTPGTTAYGVSMTHGGKTVYSNMLEVNVYHVPPHYTVLYDANGGEGTGAVFPQFYPLGEDIQLLTGDNLSRQGYQLTGWSLSADGGGTVYPLGGTAPLTDEIAGYADDYNTITFYGVWRAEGGGGSATAQLTILGYCDDQEIYRETQRHEVGKTVTVSAPKITGYTLDDEASKSITISSASGDNVLRFNYTAGGEEFPQLERENHIAYLSGYPDGSVGPNREINRAEVAQIFYRLITGEKDTVYVSKFSDVEEGAWYYDAVAYLEHFGILEGYVDGTFGPQRSITRAEFVTVASRFDVLIDGTHDFADAIGHWADEYITNASENGWVSGYPDGSFQPDKPITRAEAVTIINRILDRKLTQSDALARENPFPDLEREHWAFADVIEAAVAHDYDRRDDGTEIWK